MSNISKEELRKKLAQRKRRKSDTSEDKSPKSKKNQGLVKDQDSHLSNDLKRLGLITLIVLIIFIVIIVLKEKTELFNQLSDLFYGFIN